MHLQITTKMILHLFQVVLVYGVILGILPFELSSMTIRDLLMISSMNDILFFLCKIVSY
jgi:hypothetical protein